MEDGGVPRAPPSSTCCAPKVSHPSPQNPDTTTPPRKRPPWYSHSTLNPTKSRLCRSYWMSAATHPSKTFSAISCRRTRASSTLLVSSPSRSGCGRAEPLIRKNYNERAGTETEHRPRFRRQRPDRRGKPFEPPARGRRTSADRRQRHVDLPLGHDAQDDDKQAPGTLCRSCHCALIPCAHHGRRKLRTKN